MPDKMQWVRGKSFEKMFYNAMYVGFEDRIAGVLDPGFILYVTVVTSQNDLNIPHLQTGQVKKTCPKINTHVSCVWQEIDILSFCVTANTKDACPE